MGIRIGEGPRLGAQRDHADAHRVAVAVVERERRAARSEPVGGTDEGILAAPLVVETVGVPDFVLVGVAVLQGTQLTAHDAVVAVIERIGLGIVVGDPHVPAPQQVVLVVVGADQGIAALDDRLVVAVFDHEEGDFAVIEREVAQQIHRGLPDDGDAGGRDLRAVALARRIEEVLRIGAVGDVAVRGGIALIDHGRVERDEEGGRNGLAAVGHAAQDDRARRLGLRIVGRGSLDGHRHGFRRGIEFRLFPARRHARYAVGGDVDARKDDRSRLAALQKQRLLRIGHRAVLVVLAAGDRHCGRQKRRQADSQDFFHHMFVGS